MRKLAFIRNMDSSVWNKAKTAMTKKQESDPDMTMAKWMKTAILNQLKKEKG